MVYVTSNALVVHFRHQVVRGDEDAQWQAVESSNDPIWHKPRRVASSHYPGDIVTFTLYSADQNAPAANQNRVLGCATWCVPAKAVITEVELEMEMLAPWQDLNDTRLVFKVLPTPSPSKTLYMIRHAESRWNYAQKNIAVFDLVSDVDHGLTYEGCQQSQLLKRKIARARQRAEGGESNKGSEQGDDAPNQTEITFMQAQLLCSSPLTRSIQTACISLADHPLMHDTQDRANAGRLRLLSDAREYKSSVASFDCIGAAVGPKIVGRVVEETQKAYNGAAASMPPNAVPRQEGDGISALALEYNDCAQVWWTTTTESDAGTFETRIEEFLNYIRYQPEDSIVVVSHSYFIRALFKNYTHQHALDQNATLPNVKYGESYQVADLGHLKLENCGVVAMNLDFSTTTPIMGAKLLFGSRLEGKASAAQVTPAKEKPTKVNRQLDFAGE